MKTIHLNHSYIGFVDDEDFDRVRCWTWTIDRRAHTVYAVNSIKGRLHQFITGKTDLDIAHLDGNGLNCTKANLTICTHSVNLRHTLRTRGRIPFLGVMLSKGGRYTARLRFPDGSRPSLGTYNTPEEAARAYDRAATEAYGPAHPKNFK